MKKRIVAMQQTSLDAWDAWQGKPSADLDRAILKTLHEAGPEGRMCWQIEYRTGRMHQSVSANLRHIVKRGGAVRLDKRGKTPSGKGAYYYVHVDYRPKPCTVSAALQLQHELWV